MRPMGDERLSESSVSDPRRTPGNRDKKPASGPTPAGKEGTSHGKSPSEVGKALRSVYDATLGERVPDDFLDLLGKLN